MIAVIVPAHNEQDYLDACLKSVYLASRCPRLEGEEVQITVVLDDCTDQTASIARRWPVQVMETRARNVGIARKTGADAALLAGARWLSFTDADSTVAADWLSAQIVQGADVVCGTVGIDKWGPYGDRMAQHFRATYSDEDGHRHVHGANLGVSAEAYLKAGGFRSLESSEDVALVQDLQAQGCKIAWSAAPRVLTSARSDFRAPGGFGATLARIEINQEWAR